MHTDTIKTLTDRFYDLYYSGHIYTEPDPDTGLDMSYAEYAAISDYLAECIADHLEGLDFEDALDAYIEFVVDGADDDTRMFCVEAADAYENSPIWLFDTDYLDETGVYKLRRNHTLDDLPPALREPYEIYAEQHNIYIAA